MTAQEIFDRVATHLLTQGIRSKLTLDSSDIRCAYRGVGGLRCAVGALISDDDYLPAMDGNGESSLGIDGLVDACAHLPSIAAFVPHLELCEQLQGIHDYTAPSRWRRDLRKVAENNDLSSAVLNNFPVST